MDNDKTAEQRRKEAEQKTQDQKGQPKVDPRDHPEDHIPNRDNQPVETR